ncbi:cupin domain-containing protein [Pseudonocardia xishanensis]|uniref:(S)-ureidoglycine aminohydrolase cupin domain-containing protein n=1 Tax=Pseudonocardia xishanensis TaxID=630995 RepID=A0ABP8S098_9PSEU
MTSTTTRGLYRGNRNINPPKDEWVPFAWEDPKHGSQVKGEVVFIRAEGTSGTLMSGLWRTGHEIAGCREDGSCEVVYSAPLGDETMVILEGTADITETATGKKHRIGAGSILSHPKHVDLHWEIHSPFLKKFWVMWDSPNPATKTDHLITATISDDPGTWTPFEWDEPEHGHQTFGELFTIRDTGSTGTYKCGLWRTGVGVAGCNPDGTGTTRYTAPLGDETILLLEGQVHVKNEDTGEEFDFSAGDVIGFSSGTPITWTSKTPYVKKFWVITNEDTPTA